VEYQKALKTQVQAILQQLQTNEFETVSEYLAKSYEDGFIGAMYDMQGQGVPLVLPLDQEAIVDAIQHETNLSTDLYAAFDIKDLQKKIAGEISRGLSTGQMFSEISRNIAGYARISRNNAMRIARTEGHRIQCKAAMNACNKAKSKGADVVKQWDSTLDGKTRPSHRRIDGEIRELDEPFSNGLDYPGDPKGKASEVINCRCALLQRARWAVGNDMTKWDEEEGIVEIKAKDYNDFKNKYNNELQRVRRSTQKIKSQETLEKTAKSSTMNTPDIVKDNRVFKELTIDDFKKMKHSISKEERSIVYGKGHFSGYINSSNASKINNILRKGGTLSKNHQEIADTLQNVITKNVLNDDIMVTRYVNGDALESLIGIKVPEFKLSMKKETFWGNVEAIPLQFKSGTEYIEKGFLSTSGVSSENVMKNKLVKMNIKAPSGTNCYITTNNKESEVIFGIDTKLTITNCTIENSRQAGWKIVLDCEIE
jgi:SPP1 gp7 family putative phage head morphogenesis protein